MACTFNGVLKTITINTGVSSVSVKNDIYSEWKEWLLLSDNVKYLPAMRSIGGDPIGGGQFAGDLYFLTNGWQIVTDHPVEVFGVIYHDDGISPFVILPGGSVRSTVSSLVQSIASSGFSTTDLTIALQPVLAQIEQAQRAIEETQAFVLAR